MKTLRWNEHENDLRRNRISPANFFRSKRKAQSAARSSTRVVGQPDTNDDLGRTSAQMSPASFFGSKRKAAQGGASRSSTGIQQDASISRIGENIDIQRSPGGEEVEAASPAVEALLMLRQQETSPSYREPFSTESSSDEEANMKLAQQTDSAPSKGTKTIEESKLQKKRDFIRRRKEKLREEKAVERLSPLPSPGSNNNY